MPETEHLKEVTSPGPGSRLFSVPLAALALKDVTPLGAPDRSRLKGAINIAGVDCHVEAFEVTRDSWGELRTVDVAHCWHLDMIEQLANTDHPLDSMDIGGREYLLLILPCGT